MHFHLKWIWKFHMKYNIYKKMERQWSWIWSMTANKQLAIILFTRCFLYKNCFSYSNPSQHWWLRKLKNSEYISEAKNMSKSLEMGTEQARNIFWENILNRKYYEFLFTVHFTTKLVGYNFADLKFFRASP